MITIEVKNVKSQLSDYTPELEDRLSVFHSNYWFAPKYKDGSWDGKTHFLTVPALKFPTGLLYIVEEYFKELDAEYRIAKQQKSPKKKNDFSFKDTMLAGITLRDYQLEAIEKGILAERGIFEVATGLGKTEIAAGIIKALGLRTLFIVHTQDLLYQTAKRLSARLETPTGIIGDGVFQSEPNVVVATVQSLNSRTFQKNKDGSHILHKKTGQMMKQFLNSFAIMFQDETHHSSSISFYRIGMFMHSAYYRFGLSGTPLRRGDINNMKVQAVTGPVIYSKLAEEAIDEGHLSDIEVRIVDNDEEVLGDGTWRHIYENGIARSKHRNTLIAKIVGSMYLKRRRQLILVRHIKHGKILQRMLANRLHIPAVFLSGKDPAWKREQIKGKFNIQDMKDGGFVLIASSIFDEGVDIPEVDVLIHASGGKSEVKLIQRIGRGLRKKKSGNKLIVYDFDDKNSRFLSSHSEQRIETYEQEGFLK